MNTEFLKKASDNLNVARYCYEQSYYDAAVNRAYYASFQAAIAALADKGFVSAKNAHKWVQTTFSQELINRRKIYPGRVASFLSDMLNVRNFADYSKTFISERIASRQLARAEELVRLITTEVQP